MSVKNVSQENYNRFVKNNLIDIFSQERIKDIPRHRLVMMNNTKGGRYVPFDVHGLHNYLKHSNKHPITQSVYLSPETRKRIKDKYVASLLHDVKVMLSVSSKVSQENFVKALRKVKLSNNITNLLVKSRQNKTVPNIPNIVQHMHPNKIEQVLRILRANNNKKNNTKVPSASKDFANEQRRKHNQLLRKQRMHQAEIELNRNRNAFERASSITRKMLNELGRTPSKREFKFAELGFKMTIRDDTIVMMWYPPSRKRNRAGTMVFPPNSSSIAVPIQKMVSTAWGYVNPQYTRDRRNVNVMGTVWLVPEILDKVPGSRVTVKQMSIAVLLLLNKKSITNRNLPHNRRTMNTNNRRTNSNTNSSSNENYDASQDPDVISFFREAGLKAYSGSRNTISNLIRPVLNDIRERQVRDASGSDAIYGPGVSHVYISFIEIDFENNISINEDIYNRLNGININGLARKLTNSSNKTHQRQITYIRITGDFESTTDNQAYTFDIFIEPHTLHSVGVEVRRSEVE
jgi:hypothetical protein